MNLHLFKLYFIQEIQLYFLNIPFNIKLQFQFFHQ